MISRGSSKLLIIVVALAVVGATAANANDHASVVSLHKALAGYYSIKVQYPRFAGSSAVERKANADLARLAKTRFAGYQKDAHEALKDVGKPTAPYEFTFTPTVSLARLDLISVYFTDVTYAGGAHPNTTYVSESFGLVRGFAKRLDLADLFKPGVDARKIAAEHVYHRLKSDPGALWVEQGSITAKSPLLTRTFAITATGLTFLIEPYLVGPYSSGSFIVKTPWSAFGADLDPNGPLEPLLKPR